MNELQSAQSIYVIGIGGIGTSALAQLLKAEGKQVSGEDIAPSPVTGMLEQQGIDVVFNERGAHFETADFIYYTSAVPANHPARLAAAERGVIQMQYFEALGEYMEQFEYAIAVSGTHGKTTTTAMVSTVLIAAGFDPTAVVGSLVKEFGNTNARVGSSEKKYIVVEACEHEAHMLNLRPNVIVVNNIEADHLDYYRDVAHITETFQEFVEMLPQAQNSALIVNADDTRVLSLSPKEGVQRISYGITTAADLQAMNIGIEGVRQFFTVENQEFELFVPGEFNVSNALAAMSVARHLGIPPETVAKALAEFRGTWRRFEHMGSYHGALVISDYAHHPTEIRKTIHAAKEFYPEKRIVVVFQPHQRSRTKELFTDFTEAFIEADYLILQEIYDVAGRDREVIEVGNMSTPPPLSSRALVDAMENNGQFATYAPNAEASAEVLGDIVESDDVILLMGAGDIHNLAEALVAENVPAQ